jgi:hypothetical protein
MQPARALRPMGFLEIVDQTFRLYRANFGLFCMMAAVLYVPVNVFSAVPVLGVVIMLLSFPATFLAFGALTKAVSDRYLGTQTDIRSAYRYVWGRFWPLVGTLLLAQLVLSVVPMIGVLGAILFPVFARAREMAAMASGRPPSMDVGSMVTFLVVVAIVAGVAMIIGYIWLTFITPVVVVEDVRYLAAIRRAWFLIRQWTWWRVFWIGVILTGIVTVLMLVLFGTAMFLPGRAAQPTAGVSIVALLVLSVAEAVIVPLFLVALIFVYYDSRIRKEGFDLQMLAREMGAVLPQAAAPGPPPTGTVRPPTPRVARPQPMAPAGAAPAPPAAPAAPPAGAAARAAWQPSDPRLASRMPLSALRRIFVFTDSDGRTTPSSAAVLDTVQDTAGAPVREFETRVPVHIIGQSNAAAEVTRTRAVPEPVWEAMSRIDADLTARARGGQARTCVRGFEDPETREHGVIIMVYDV